MLEESTFLTMIPVTYAFFGIPDIFRTIFDVFCRDISCLSSKAVILKHISYVIHFAGLSEELASLPQQKQKTNTVGCSLAAVRCAPAVIVITFVGRLLRDKALMSAKNGQESKKMCRLQFC